MYKYAQLESFHHDHRLQVYMYAFMYVYHKTMPVGDHFPSTKIFLVNYKKISTPGPVPKHWLGFSYILSEDYELDVKFDETELKKSDHTSNNEVQIFC